MADEIPGTNGCVVKRVDEVNEKVRIVGPDGTGGFSVSAGCLLPQTAGVRNLLGPSLDVRVEWVDTDTVELDVVNLALLLGSLESKRVGVQRFAGSDKLGMGIPNDREGQTSFVGGDRP